MSNTPCKECECFTQEDNFLDLDIQATARTLSIIEREIFEAEKLALTDWHARLADLHRQHFEEARKLESLEAAMKERYSQVTKTNTDGTPF